MALINFRELHGYVLVLNTAGDRRAMQYEHGKPHGCAVLRHASGETYFQTWHRGVKKSENSGFDYLIVFVKFSIHFAIKSNIV
jgi:hypothetical protein